MVIEFADNGDLLAHLKWLDQINSKVIQNLDSSEWKAYLQNTQPRLFLYMWHIAKGMEFLSRLKHREKVERYGATCTNGTLTKHLIKWSGLSEL